MRLSVLATLVLAALIGLLPVATASANTETFEASFLIGQGVVSGAPIAVEGPVVARAANGDTLELMGSGQLSFALRKGENAIHAAGASGTGTFVHRDASGRVLGEGTWEVVDLLDFHSYGSGQAQDLPMDNWGGLAQLQIRVTSADGSVSYSGQMWVDCLLGSPPADAQEGVRVALPGVIDFDTPIHGETLFVAH